MKKLLLVALALLLPVAAHADSTSLLGVFNQDNAGTICSGFVDQFGGEYINNVNQICISGSPTGSASSITAISSTANGGLGFQDSNASINITPNGSGTVNITNLSAVGKNVTQGVPFSILEAGNPLMLMTQANIVVASINAAGGYTFLTGVSGRTIYPDNVIMTALGGAAATATGVFVECSSGRALASYAIAQLTSGVPSSAFSASVTPGLGLTGCASGDGLLISKTGGTLGTATSIMVNVPYTVQ